MTDTWNHVRNTPPVGGSYIIGGYVEVTSLPRHFERAWATLILTTDGPSWLIVEPGKKHIPIQYWIGLPAHPEHVAAPPATESTTKKPRCKACEDTGWLFNGIDAEWDDCIICGRKKEGKTRPRLSFLPAPATESAADAYIADKLERREIIIDEMRDLLAEPCRTTVSVGSPEPSKRRAQIIIEFFGDALAKAHRFEDLLIEVTRLDAEPAADAEQAQAEAPHA